jgi:peroxiredoxin Q/BCP
VRPPVSVKTCGASRATLIVGPDGKVVHLIPKVSPKTHDEQVLEVLDDMSPGVI